MGFKELTGQAVHLIDLVTKILPIIQTSEN